MGHRSLLQCDHCGRLLPIRGAFPRAGLDHCARGTRHSVLFVLRRRNHHLVMDERLCAERFVGPYDLANRILTLFDCAQFRANGEWERRILWTRSPAADDLSTRQIRAIHKRTNVTVFGTRDVGYEKRIEAQIIAYGFATLYGWIDSLLHTCTDRNECGSLRY